MKFCFPEVLPVCKYSKKIVYTSYKYVDDKIKQINAIVLFTPGTEHTFSLSSIKVKPLLDVETLEEKIKETILRIYLKKETDCHHRNKNKRKQCIQKEKI